jgi:hypothetical protein
MGSGEMAMPIHVESPTAGLPPPTAEREGRISGVWAERLDAARRLRNGFAHPGAQRTFTIGMAASLLAAAHEVCCELAAQASRDFHGDRLPCSATIPPGARLMR